MSKFFRIVGEIQAIETIASGVGVKIRQRLQQRYGRGAWRKMKGLATICLANGKYVEAEVHWYEAHGVGKKSFKIKRIIS